MMSKSTAVCLWHISVTHSVRSSLGTSDEFKHVQSYKSQEKEWSFAYGIRSSEKVKTCSILFTVEDIGQVSSTDNLVDCVEQDVENFVSCAPLLLQKNNSTSLSL